ncbi:lipooligosaccharide transport system permease protein [Amycolatopsis xylanica]|uniref:Transport permease protein n=1 Tax=Amycolatopsis xylanica TaxID=589385 RepID=A0A1H3HI65_9PSEU|nr:ABC transporter permease [Amycolatopsis xylanica]SDY15167.1 lipooligosaccharide transport system permease protein [Amycolatopsis xylanica]
MTTARSTGRVPGAWAGAWAQVEAYWTWYRRYWRATLYSSGLQPVLFLGAMGLGFGSQVEAGPATGGLPYLQYIAPCLLVAGGIQFAVGESTYAVLSGFKWQRHFVAATATPVSPGQVCGGHAIWIGIRLLLAAVTYAVVAAFFGAWANAGVLLVIVIGVFAGMATAAPIMAFAAATHDEGERFGMLFRFVLMPMILFSGTFFPISQLPLFLRWLTWISPLWHGNELARGAMGAGPGPLALLGHFAFLCALSGAGAYLARRNFYRRLVV